MLKEILKKLPDDIPTLLKRRYKIIIVDDNVRNVELFEQQFQQAGYETAACYSGNQVLDVVSRENPDLVLLDIMMPNLDGYQTCKLLKEKFREKFLPIILISVKDEPESKVKGLVSGADDYLTKPYDFQELKIRVQHLLQLVQMDEDQKILFQYYQKSIGILKEIEILMESLKYAVGKIYEGKEKKTEKDREFVEEKIESILSKMKSLWKKS